jgi:DNA polymerase
MFIGEGPGADEDRTGRPFVGAAGQLLDKMIVAMQFQREEVYIANVVKCRPPGNRDPEPDEAVACLPYLQRQIELIQPQVIVTLGRTPLRYLLGLTGITARRGKWLEWRGIPCMPTFHPSYLLRVPGDKGKVWSDLQQVMRRLGKTPPARGER